jgi:hypothetical protein
LGHFLKKEKIFLKHNTHPEKEYRGTHIYAGDHQLKNTGRKIEMRRK